MAAIGAIGIGSTGRPPISRAVLVIVRHAP
jgi:hypothetical protein